MLLQQAVDVGQLCNHADRTKNRKRRADDLLADARHHVAAAGRDLVDAHGQRHAGFTDPRQLRGCQTVAVNHAATAFQTQDHFVLWRGERQQCGDFMAQAFGGRGLDVAVEIQHEHTRFGVGLFLLLLRIFLGFGLALAQSLELILVEQRLLQALTQALVEIIEFADLQLTGRFAPALAAQCGKTGKHHQNGDYQGDGLGQEAGVFGEKLHKDSLNDARM
ncbi:hypothetical protein D3C87_936010 [compost metagenome]